MSTDKIENRKVTFVATIYLSESWDEGFPDGITDAKLVEEIEDALTHEHFGIAGYQQARVVLVPDFDNPFPE